MIAGGYSALPERGVFTELELERGVGATCQKVTGVIGEFVQSLTRGKGMGAGGGLVGR